MTDTCQRNVCEFSNSYVFNLENTLEQYKDLLEQKDKHHNIILTQYNILLKQQCLITQQWNALFNDLRKSSEKNN